LRQGLIGASRLVTEGARQRVVGNDAEADLVRHQHDAPAHLGQHRTEPRHFRRHIPAVIHQIVDPDGDAFDEDEGIGVICGPQLPDEINRRFDRRPAGAALVPVQQVSSQLSGLLGKLNYSSGPSQRDILDFTTQLAVMIRAGISIRAALEGISEQVQNKKFRRILLQVGVRRARRD